jgi:hypothetical protein
MKNWINNHQRVLIFAAIFTILGLIRFIPAYEKIFIGQRFIQAVAQVVHGFADIFAIFSRLLPTPLKMVGFFVILFIFGILYGLTLIKLWKWKGWLGKFLALLLVLINSLPGLFAVNASDTLIGKPYATCNKEISESVTVRIVAYPEIGWIAGSHQFYSISRDEGRTWHQFMHFRHDDPVPPNCDNIQSSTSNHIWVWTNSLVAVTENTGMDWHTWSKREDCRRCIIESVMFQDSNAGHIELSPIDDEGEKILLYTEDGGETWK